MEGVILSSWDHIMGPQIERLWVLNDSTGTKFSEVSCDILKDFNTTKLNKYIVDSVTLSDMPDLEAYSIMCGQLLLGEVDSCKPFEEWASRFYLSDSKVLISVVFHLNSWICLVNEPKNKKDVCLCFGVIFKRIVFDFALDNQRVIDFHLRKVVDIMQNCKIPFELLMKEINAIIEDIVTLLVSLRAFNLNNMQIHLSPTFRELMHSDLVSKAIVSHLQTSGCSVIIGGSNFLISQVTFVLSIFSPPRESHSCLLFPHFASNTYIDGINLQGAIKAMNMDYKYLLEKAFKESLFLTIVDTDLCKVWQAGTVHNTTNNFRNTSVQITETGHIIPQLLKDISFIQKNGGDCKILLQNFFKHLMVQAFSLIKTLEPLRNSQSGISAKDVMTMFAIDNIVDLKIIFGCAEKLKPGFRSIIS